MAFTRLPMPERRGRGSWPLPRSNLDPFYAYGTKWYGCYSWYPVNDVIYATAMSHPAFKNQLSTAAKSKRQSNL